jgi:hypothetical protein
MAASAVCPPVYVQEQYGLLTTCIIPEAPIPCSSLRYPATKAVRARLLLNTDAKEKFKGGPCPVKDSSRCERDFIDRMALIVHLTSPSHHLSTKEARQIARYDDDDSEDDDKDDDEEVSTSLLSTGEYKCPLGGCDNPDREQS